MDIRMLEGFENHRGLAYLLIAVSMLCPTTVALFASERALFMQMEWQKILLLCIGVGGFCYVALVAIFSFIAMLARMDEPDPHGTLLYSLGAGGVLSITLQVAAFLTTTMPGIDAYLAAVLRGIPKSIIGFAIVEVVARLMRNRKRLRVK